MMLAHCWCCSEMGNAARHQYRKINYLKHIYIAKYLITRKNMCMLLHNSVQFFLCKFKVAFKLGRSCMQCWC